MPKKAPQILTLDTLATLHDGAYGVRANDLLQQALKDCEDRPGLKTNRVVTLRIEFTPEGEGGMSETTISVGATGKVTIPPVKTRKQPMTIRRDSDTGQPYLVIPEPNTPIFDEENSHD
jgi:hypothetical protein